MFGEDLHTCRSMHRKWRQNHQQQLRAKGVSHLASVPSQVNLSMDLPLLAGTVPNLPLRKKSGKSSRRHLKRFLLHILWSWVSRSSILRCGSCWIHIFVGQLEGRKKRFIWNILVYHLSCFYDIAETKIKAVLWRKFEKLIFWLILIYINWSIQCSNL